MNGYFTVTRASETVTEIRKSKFIGRCFPVADEAEARSVIERLRKKHYDASHNCYAYSITGETGSETAARYSDDGEPGGTAGLPMMEVLKSKRVTNALVVVTRYFGGVLLGAGGLVRAYTKSAASAVETAIPAFMANCILFKLSMDYPLRAKAEKVCETQEGCKVAAIDYTDKVEIEAAVKEAEADTFVSRILQATDGKVRPIELKKACYPFPVSLTYRSNVL